MRVMRRGGVEQPEDTLMKTAKNIEKSQIEELKPKQYGGSCSGGLRSKGRNFRDLFTPCAVTSSLLKLSHLAAKNALPGDVILFSPACSSFDQFHDNQGAEKLCLRAAKTLAPTMDGRNTDAYPTICRRWPKSDRTEPTASKIIYNLPRVFLRKNPGAKITTPKNHLTMKGR